MFLEISRNYVSIIITIIRNITVLVSHNVICLEYFITMSHSIKRRLLQLSPHPPPPYQIFTKFVSCFARNTLSTFFFAPIKLLKKIMHFQSKTVFFLQLIARWFWFCYFLYMSFLERFSKFCP